MSRIACLLPVLLSLLALVARPVRAEEPAPLTKDHAVLYAMGYEYATRVSGMMLTPAEIDTVVRGLRDGLELKPAEVDPRPLLGLLSDLQEARFRQAAEAEGARWQPFLDEAARAPNAARLPSGLVIRTLRPGTGESPEADDEVLVNYTSQLPDGTIIESSLPFGKPARVSVSRVIRCWSEGMRHMQVGGSYQLTCPGELAYGIHGNPPKVRPGAAIVVDMEILSIEGREGAGTRPLPDAHAGHGH